LAFLTVQISQDQAQLECVGIELRGPFEFLDGEIDLAGHEVIQAEDEVGRLPDAAAIDPASLDEFVALPRLAGGQSDEQCEEDAEDETVTLHGVLRLVRVNNTSPAPLRVEHEFHELAHRAAPARVPADP